MPLLKKKIQHHAIQIIGFDDCRFSDLKSNNDVEYYREWLENNYHGDMEYLENHLKFKENPALLLEGAQTAIVVIKNYKNTDQQKLSGNFKIARYAVGKDYHITIDEQLTELEKFIHTLDPTIKTYCGVDSKPISERSLALRAGLGFLGKNSMVIKPGLGSYFFIGVIFTTLKIPTDQPMKWDCGDCRLCIDACPTNAILENFSLDATKCISYQTIEQKEPLSAQQLQKSEGWLFGCDICQEVCPYNNENSPLTDWTQMRPEAGVGFDFLQNLAETTSRTKIPQNSPLYRSRKRVIPNVEAAKRIHQK